MVMINRATKEITFKVVYYGPGLCGKTTNLEYIYSSANPSQKGKLLTVATETDRTLFFDFMPLELGTIRGMKVRVQLYTVPGQVFYDATRRIVLRGSDGVVFVADSQSVMMDANIESLENLKANLKLNSLDPQTVPLVLQYNKQDLPGVAPQEEIDRRLNWRGVPSFPSVATTGLGVNETLKKIIELVIRKLQAQDAHFGARPEAEASPAATSPAKSIPPPPLPTAPPPPSLAPPTAITPPPPGDLPIPEFEIKPDRIEPDLDVEPDEIESLHEIQAPTPTEMSSPATLHDPEILEDEPSSTSGPRVDLVVEMDGDAPPPPASPIEADPAKAVALQGQDVQGEAQAAATEFGGRTGLDPVLARETLGSLVEVVLSLARRARDLEEEAQSLVNRLEAIRREWGPGDSEK